MAAAMLVAWTPLHGWAEAPERSPLPAPRPVAADTALAAGMAIPRPIPQPMPRPRAQEAAAPADPAPAHEAVVTDAGPTVSDPVAPADPEVAAAEPGAAPAEAPPRVTAAAADTPRPAARSASPATVVPAPRPAVGVPHSADATSAVPLVAARDPRDVDPAAPPGAGGEPAPVVRTATAGIPRPAERPEPMEVEVSTRGAFAPIDLALRPQLRPDGLAVPAPGRPAAAPMAALAGGSATTAAISSLAVANSRLPRLRPEAERRAFVQRVAAVRTQPAPGAVTGRATGQLCGQAGIEGHSIPAVISNVQGCGVPNAVRVKAVDGVRLSESAIMDCDTARALHAWVRTGLKPAVGNLGGGVTGLRVAGHYVCRTQNHRAGARISEHGRGRAIDISGIRLADGRMLDVLRHWRHASYGPVLQQAHRAACGPFNTTLGPGSDGMHEDHFHYDLRRGGRYCR